MDTSVLFLVIITTILFIVRTVISAFSQDINIIESFNLNSMPDIIKHMSLQVLFIIPFITFIITLVKYVRMKNKINDYYNNLPSTIRDHVCCKEAVGYLNRDIEKQLCRDIHGIEREPILNLRDRLFKLDQRRNNSYEKSFPESYKILFDK